MAVTVLSRTVNSATLRLRRTGSGQFGGSLFEMPSGTWKGGYQWSSGYEVPVGGTIDFTATGLSSNTEYEYYYTGGDGVYYSFYFKTLPDIITKNITGAVKVVYSYSTDITGAVKIVVARDKTITGTVRVDAIIYKKIKGAVRVAKNLNETIIGSLDVKKKK